MTIQDKIAVTAAVMMGVLFILVVIGWLQYGRNRKMDALARKVEEHDDILNDTDLKYQRRVEHLKDIAANGQNNTSYRTTNGNRKKGAA